MSRTRTSLVTLLALVGCRGDWAEGAEETGVPASTSAPTDVSTGTGGMSARDTSGSAEDETSTGAISGPSSSSTTGGEASSGEASSGEASSDDAPVPTCEDGVQNGGETDVDCGGPCRPCSDGCSCVRDADCAEVPDACHASMTCFDCICMPPTPIVCDDRIACTTDDCDGKTGCVFTPDDTVCPKGEVCDPKLGCVLP